MELSEADRLCLAEAESHGRLVAPIVRAGREVPDGVALKRHLDGMVRRGLLADAGKSGSEARVLAVAYEATEAGLELMRAVEVRDQAMQMLAQCRGALAAGGSCEYRLSEIRELLQGPRWWALVKAAEPSRRH
ncbi:hypothetical protein [Caulobacter sp. 17J80-11]|uniref:hypothetical protein n=1 Tax=Caulobacter sp. 17J80-11 TaxID=2763502 RepID=UPI0016535384|nr:hypothetical protein [Caulobacter sp. 17J80-11]MBC6982181.1 hypothetical protein [Caulobacter sp. 17J80-11]